MLDKNFMSKVEVNVKNQVKEYAISASKTFIAAFVILLAPPFAMVHFDSVIAEVGYNGLMFVLARLLVVAVLQATAFTLTYFAGKLQKKKR